MEKAVINIKKKTDVQSANICIAYYSTLWYTEIGEQKLIKPVHPKTIVIYQDHNEYEPFTEWLNSLKDKEGRKRILARLRRLEQGNYGDCKALKDGVMELRIFSGPGYRIYFAEEDDQIVILLCGGDKSSQQEDIMKAKQYWKEYQDHA